MRGQQGSIAAKLGGRKPKNAFKTFARLFSYYKECRAKFVLAVIIIVVYAIAVIAAAYMMRPLVSVLESSGVAEERYAKYIALLVGMAGLYFTAVITNYFLNRLMLECAVKVLCRLRIDTFNHMQDLPISFFDGITHGELMSFYTNDTDAVRELLHHSITQMIISVTSLLGIIAFMLVLSPFLFIIVAVMGFIIFLITRTVGVRSGKNFAKQQSAVSKVNGYIEEMMAGQKVVKAFNHETLSKAGFDELNNDLKGVAIRANTLANIVGPVMNNLSHIFYALTTTIGVLFAVQGSVLIAFLQFIRQFAERIAQISEQFNFIMLALAGAERIFNLLDEPVESDEGCVTLVCAREENGVITECEERTDVWAWKEVTPEGVKYVRLRGDVRFYNVNFSYVPEKQVLKNVSLYAKEGQKIAFVGSTGAGKTTITNLINRFYDVSDGTITYDGIEINRIKKADLRRSLGMVLQDTHLFSGTVMENIRYGRLSATDEECVAAAKIANADYFISHLPEGYDTMLIADGANLSQGQRQLLSIARAAVSDPPVLILDEATSSIDTRTEKLIEKGMDGLMAGRTVFVIAHRLSTVRNSNAIMVLEKGEIIERGDHDDLLAQKGKYYSLYTGKTELS
ncbi:MAG: ABC transporter ATP-binding protein [Clostridia bacterium]|nr:ABC transporter ATP-binding protein [Clostridia bacterium]